MTENYLEIHLLWVGKGTCCIPEDGNYGPLIAAVHVASGNLYFFRWLNVGSVFCYFRMLYHCVVFSSDFTHRIAGASRGTSKTGVIVGSSVAAAAVVLASIFAIFYLRRKSRDDDEGNFLVRGVMY